MTASGFVMLASDADYRTTVARLEHALAARGITPIARIDHGAAGEAAGTPLAPTLLILFGNPRIGTPLMQQERSWAIDLPLKLLVWQAGEAVRVGYTDPVWLMARHGAGPVSSVEAMRHLLAELAYVATTGDAA